MTSLRESVEQDIAAYDPLEIGTLTEYGMAIKLAQEARQDAKDWMTRYHIEKEISERAEKEVEKQRRDSASLSHQRDRAERKNRLLANVIATLIDSEEFV